VSVVCVCRVVRACVYEQMLQLYPDERHQKKNDPSTISIEHPILKFSAKLDKDPSEESVLRYLYEHKSLTVAA